MSYKQIQEAMLITDKRASEITLAIEKHAVIVTPKHDVVRMELIAMKEQWTTIEIMFMGAILIKMLGVDYDDEIEQL